MNPTISATAKFCCFLLLISSLQLNAAVKLPRIFTNNMVLQRNRAVNVWGWAEKGETVVIRFNGQAVKAKAQKDGRWFATLEAMVFGGPFEMNISGKSDKILLKNILIGDVWVASGQSNMEWLVQNTNNAEKEIAESNYPKIRLFSVEKAKSYTPLSDLAGGLWLECNAKTIGDFSAVAYFFGRKLEQELDVPIGLINSSWGGTNIETWISFGVISHIEPYTSLSLEENVKKGAEQEQKQEQYLEALKHDKGLIEKWYSSSGQSTGWKKIAVPKEWGETEIGNADGIAWFRKEFEVPAAWAGNKAMLSLGPVDDADVTYVNGKEVGSENNWSKGRVYNLPEGVLVGGKNLLVIKITDERGGGGIYGKPEEVFCEVDGHKIGLAGEWEYRPSVLTTDFGVVDVSPNSFPALLFNAMIAPITSFTIKGAIWYQGESNAGQSYRYRALFPTMINDWRNRWGYAFPFFWVQLANFMEPSEQPSESGWAELREAQSLTLSLPKRGQAVIIDIGEASTVHPRNKQDVGYRLALSALKIAYDKDVVYSGPVFQSMKTEGDKIVLSFSNTGNGLQAKDKYGYLKGFAIAGSDHKFVWAKAYIEGNNVIVSSPSVAKPVAVRYAWGNNPADANFYNQEGLPASPFRTDSWTGVTEGK